MRDEVRIKDGDNDVGIKQAESSGPGDGLGLWDRRGEVFRAVPQVLSGQLDEEEERIR